MAYVVTEAEFRALEKQINAMAAKLAAAEKRLAVAKRRIREIAEVPCVEEGAWRRYPMRCYPKDPCTFCRCKETLDQLGAAAGFADASTANLLALMAGVV